MTHQYYIAKTRTIKDGYNGKWEYHVRAKNKIKKDRLSGVYQKLEEIIKKIDFTIERVQFISDPIVKKLTIDFHTLDQVVRQYAELSTEEFGLVADYLVEIPLDKQIESIGDHYKTKKNKSKSNDK